jgi:hypothetical protein
MRKQSLRIVVLFSFIAVLAVSSVQAQQGRELTARIPFSFVVGNERFPAGDYSLTRLNPQSDRAAVAIKSMDGRRSKVVLLIPVRAVGKTQEGARLVFTQYDEHYFLSQVWTPADRTGLELPKSRSERTLLARTNAGENAPQRTTVALNPRRR